MEYQNCKLNIVITLRIDGKDLHQLVCLLFFNQDIQRAIVDYIFLYEKISIFPPSIVSTLELEHQKDF